MGSAFHQLCFRYSKPLTPIAPTPIMLRETFTFLLFFKFSRFYENDILAYFKFCGHDIPWFQIHVVTEI